MKLLALASTVLGLATACHTPANSELRTWGAMRSVLREGRTEGRVALDEVLRPGTYGVGALAELRGEITVVDGVAHVSTVDASGDRVHTRTSRAGDEATLLALGQVTAWREVDLPAVPDVAALERELARLLDGRSPEPFPFRVEASTANVHLHVLDGACPIANPTGPAPWRATLEGVAITLVGLYAENAAGVLTHHGRVTHLHAVVESPYVSGHVDDVSWLEGARLFVPAE